MRFTPIHSLLAAALFTVAGLAQSIPASPPQAPRITPVGPQRQQPPSPRPASPGARMPRPIPAPYQGTVEGFVYWDANTVSHIPANSCSGLAITVSVGSPTNPNVMQPQQFTPLGTLSNNFKYVGTVGKYGVCTYAYDHVPVGPDLHVQASITSPGAFSPFVLPAVQILPAKIINGQCNNLWSLSPSISELQGDWWTCQNAAWNVNFVLQPSAHILGFSGSGGSSNGQFTGGMKPGTAAAANPAAKNGMLSGGRSTLLSATPSGAPSPQLSGTRSHLPAATPGEIMPTDRPGVKTLTNADVIRMVKAGLPDSVIASSIQSARGNFDFSPAACQRLKQAHVSAAILNAMGDSSVRPCAVPSANNPGARPQTGITGAGSAAVSGGGSTVALNPQPLPPRNKRGAAIAQLPVKLGAPKILATVKNPRSAQLEAPIIAVLQRQKQAADGELAQMRSAQNAIAPAASQPSRSGANRMLLAPASTVVSAPRPQLSNSPGQTQSFSTKLIGQAPHLQTTPCIIASTSMAIGTIAGAQQGVILSADPNVNLYTVTGCNLGDPDPQNKAYIYGANGFHQDLQVQYWSQSGVAVNFDPNQNGVSDMDPVFLVLHRADGQQAEKGGLKFYAARATVSLAKIPGGQVNPYQDSWVALSSNSPAPDLAQYSIEIARNLNISMDRTTSNATVNGGTSVHINDSPSVWAKYEHLSGDDYFDISNLAPGFSADSVMLAYWNPSPYGLCGAGDDISHTAGESLPKPIYITGFTGDADGSIPYFTPEDWTVEWQGNTVHTHWPSEWCEDLEVFRNNHVSYSQYALQVWVTGPRGVDPWTGKPLLH